LRLGSGGRTRYTAAVDAFGLPVLSSGPRALDAASLGLTARGDARAHGLFDRFGRSHTYLRISIIEKCNLRCRYCTPDEGVALRAGGLDAVNLSLDTLRPDRFREITLRDGCEETIAAIRAAAAAGFDSVKVNAVVMAGVNDDELVDLARAFALDEPIEVRYIE